MTKYNFNGPPRCTKCFKYYSEKFSQQKYCLLCSLENKLIDLDTYNYYNQSTQSNEQSTQSTQSNEQPTQSTQSNEQSKSIMGNLITKVFKLWV